MACNDNNPLCINCFYFREFETEETKKEMIERENKPKPIGFIQFIDSLINPSKYEKIYDDVDEILDRLLLLKREMGVCKSVPYYIEVRKDSFCRFFKLKGS